MGESVRVVDSQRLMQRFEGEDFSKWTILWAGVDKKESGVEIVVIIYIENSDDLDSHLDFVFSVPDVMPLLSTGHKNVFFTFRERLIMDNRTQKLMFSSKNSDWRTPKSFFKRLDSEYHFTTDVGASKETALCEDYLGIDNGRRALATPWGSINYCNPPYGRQVGDWIATAYQESLDSKIVVMLLPARTDTKWFHNWIMGKASEVRFIQGRIKFEGATTGAPFPSMVVIYDHRRVRRVESTMLDGTFFTSMRAEE